MTERGTLTLPHAVDEKLQASAANPRDAQAARALIVAAREHLDELRLVKSMREAVVEVRLDNPPDDGVILIVAEVLRRNLEYRRTVKP